MPVEIFGIWDEGYVIDNYSVSSRYIGEDPFGFRQFDTTYTKIGKLLHAMKYNRHFDTSERIVDYCYDFLKQWLADKMIDAVIPVPPTKDRTAQPVYLIASGMASRFGFPYTEEVLEKTSAAESKNMDKQSKNLHGTVVKKLNAKRKCNILLIDDFFSTGETAAECVRVLKEDELIDKVYYLAIAKTK